ncbi:exonuclease domain-containing protein [Ancrocorticia populi]|uniref:DNA polymerase III subunit epsilon n=1 Tax=Ancrocorticia populi TaxID=2175228 RepID=A0A2V1K7R5_9ACTO|nr:exonuclease domain-containing protein [Ancrocorticia populi]PWF27496.1 DNA polymerase III subunit epsilon [Ancrocorticia populi]
MWTEHPIIGFDTETTGVRPDQDRLVTCSVVEVLPSGVNRTYWLADPGVEIPERATAVHGITTEQARENGRPITEVLEEIAAKLAAHMSQSYPVVAFNASYDVTLLEHELERHGLQTLASRLGGEIFPVVDPYLLDKSVDRYRKGKRRLEDLVGHYRVDVDGDFHNAEADVLATLKVLAALVRKFPELASEPLEAVQAREKATHKDFISFLNSKNRNAGDPDAWPVTC